MATTVINIRDAPRDFADNPDFVFIGRPSKWGNPYPVKVYGREGSIRRYREWIPNQPHLLRALDELRDKTLVCFCKPLPCHGDVLVELIEEEPCSSK